MLTMVLGYHGNSARVWELPPLLWFQAAWPSSSSRSAQVVRLSLAFTQRRKLRPAKLSRVTKGGQQDWTGHTSISLTPRSVGLASLALDGCCRAGDRLWDKEPAAGRRCPAGLLGLLRFIFINDYYFCLNFFPTKAPVLTKGVGIIPMETGRIPSGRGHPESPCEYVLSSLKWL